MANKRLSAGTCARGPSGSRDFDVCTPATRQEGQEDEEGWKITRCTIKVIATRQTTKVSPPNAVLVGICDVMLPSFGSDFVPLYMSGKKRRSTVKSCRYRLEDVLIWRDSHHRRVIIILPETMVEQSYGIKRSKMDYNFHGFDTEVTLPSSTIKTVKHDMEPDKSVVYLEGIASEVDQREVNQRNKARSVFKLCDKNDDYLTVVLYHTHTAPPKIGKRACLRLSSFKTFRTKENNAFNCISSTDYSIVERLENPKQHLLNLMGMEFNFDTGMDQLKGTIVQAQEATTWAGCPVCRLKELIRTANGTFSCRICGGNFKKVDTKKGYSMMLSFKLDEDDVSSSDSDDDDGSGTDDKNIRQGLIFKPAMLEIMRKFAMKEHLDKSLEDLRSKLEGQKVRLTIRTNVGENNVFSNIRFIDDE